MCDIHLLGVLVVLAASSILCAEADTPDPRCDGFRRSGQTHFLVGNGSTIADHEWLQTLLDCAPGEPTIALNASEVVLEKPLVVNRPIKIVAASGIEKIGLSCFGDRPSLVIRSQGVQISNLYIEGCTSKSAAGPISLEPGSAANFSNLQCWASSNADGPGCVTVENAIAKFTNSVFEGNAGSGGGALSVVNGSLVEVVESLFKNNTAESIGGAIQMEDSTVHAIDTRFLKNRALLGGGVIHGTNSRVLLNHTDFVGNTANGALLGRLGLMKTKGGLGGGVCLSGKKSSLRIAHSKFAKNAATYEGGALHLTHLRKVEILGSFFVGNDAFQGGAVNAEGVTSGDSVTNFFILKSRFMDNSVTWQKTDADMLRGNAGLSPYGGGVFLQGSIIAVMFNVVFQNNTSPFKGGAVCGKELPALSIHNAEFLDNMAGGLGGGAVAFEGRPNGTASRVLISNSTLSGNSDSMMKATEIPEFGGGAVLVVKADLIVRSVAFFRNQAAVGFGGAINAVNLDLDQPTRVSISESSFSENQAVDGGSVVIGGPGVTETSMTDSEFIGNLGRLNGAAVFLHNTTNVVLDGVLFKNNSCSEQRMFEQVHMMDAGGTLATRGSVNSSLVMSNVAFIENFCTSGAGFFMDGVKTVASMAHNVTFSRNVAVVFGGGIRLVSGELHINDSKFVQNRAKMQDGGAISVNAAGKWMVLEVNGSIFTENSASHGGACAVRLPLSQMSFLPHGRVTFTNTEFTRNKVEKFGNFLKNNFFGGFVFSGGAVSIVGKIPTVFKGVVFSENEGHNGAGLAVLGQHNVTVEECIFDANHALQSGGAIYTMGNILLEKALIIQSTSLLQISASGFTNNMAGDPDSNSHDSTGGAIVLSSTTSSIEECFFTDNLAANGGGIWAEAAALEMASTRFVRNQAMFGGALRNLLEMDSNIWPQFDCTGCVFDNNVAAHTGGAVLLGSTENGTISTNGGKTVPGKVDVLSVFVPQNHAVFKSSVFTSNVASDRGGAMDISRVFVGFDDCVVSHNAAGIDSGLVGQTDRQGRTMGGGLCVNGMARVQLNHSVVVANKAHFGGGVFVENSVVVGDHVVSNGNVADFSGGGFCMKFDSLTVAEKGVLMECDSCSFVKNKAQKGGGISLNIETATGYLKDCGKLSNPIDSRKFANDYLFKLESACKSAHDITDMVASRHIVLRNTTMSHNTATADGSAVFANSLESVRICCTEDCADPTQNGARLKLPDIGPCLDRNRSNASGGVIWENNTLSYGSDTSQDGGTSVLGSLASQLSLKPSRVINHTSGTMLQSVNVLLEDALGQKVPMSEGTLVVRSDAAGIIAGEPVSGISIRGPKTDVSGITLRAHPGEYVLTFQFTLEGAKYDTLSANLTVVVRKCHIGEVIDEDGMDCFHCKADFYSFDPAVGFCQSCPKMATCNGSTLVPMDGYWHSHSMDTVVHRCLYHGACSYLERDNALAKEAAHAHEIGELLTWDGNYSLCAKGYRGVLCGGCENGYGKSSSMECSKCTSKTKSILFISAAFFWGAIVAAVLIYNALTPRVVDTLTATISQRVLLDSQEYEGKFAHVVQMPVGRLDSGCDSKPPLASCASMGSNGCGGKVVEGNPATEAFKVLINFVQVTSIAAAVNLEWSNWVMGVLAFADVIGGFSETTQFVSLECAFSTYQTKAVWATIVPILSLLPMWCLFNLIWWVWTLIKNQSVRSFVNGCVVSMIVISNFAYIGITGRLVRIFHCIDVHQSFSEPRFWAEDTSIACYEGAHAALAVLGGILLVVITVGLPAGLICTLLCNKHRLNEMNFIRRYGFLYKAYKRHAVFWEAVILARKGILAIIVVFASSLGSELQGILALATLVAALVLHIEFNPYDDRMGELNCLEFRSLVVSILTFVSGLAFNSNRLSDVAFVLLSVFIVVLVCGFMLYLFWKLFVAGMQWLNRWLEEHHLADAESSAKEKASAVGKYVFGTGVGLIREGSGALLRAVSLPRTISNDSESG